MEGPWQELFRFLEQLGEKLDQLTDLAHEKTAAVMRDDLMGVSECMKKEQAVSLALRSMDAKREKLLRQLGLDDIPLRALPEHCPESIRLQARQTSESIRDKYMIYQSAAGVARNTLEINLHQIEKILEAEGGDSGTGGGLADIRA